MDTATELVTGSSGMALAVVWGALWGSFFNVVIARWPRGISVVRPASHCFACGAPVRARDNVPVLSYLWLRGRCRACGARFSARYPAVEALTAGLSVALWWTFLATATSEGLAFGLGRLSLHFSFVGLLVVLSFIDLDTRRLPDGLTLPGTLALFVAGLALGDVPWMDRAIGIVAGYLFVRLIADFYYYVLKREGLGLGDGKLLAMIGAVEGWKALPVVIFLASLLGTFISVPLLVLTRRRRRSQPEPAAPPPATDGSPPPPGNTDSIRNVQIPFGPFLALGAIIYLFAGGRIVFWFLGNE